MKQIIIDGNHMLTGRIEIGGAKNSAVALIPAALLSDDVVTIDNIPNISDIDALNEILEYLGAKVVHNDKVMVIDSQNINNREIPENISSKLRASYYFMSALLGKYRHVEMYFPGGCSIGARPIDQTLKAFEQLGAKVIEEDKKYIIDAEELRGCTIYLDMPSVGATINTMLASVRAIGETTIRNAAKEPEIVNVATFLNNMGAKISGAGTSEIRIIGVEKLGKGFTEVIPDRIEAGTYIIAGALVGNNLEIANIIPEHIEALLLKLQEMDVNYKITDNSIIISKGENLKPIRLKTLGYPGFPTDLQQPLTALLVKCHGTSTLEETIYENRFKNVDYLNEMGASIDVINNQKIKINGPSELTGAEVVATDLRAGACMVLAALAATGKTIIRDVNHILRGYENIIEKLTGVGAKIYLEDK
ncbi:MAG: UDP-N-acetylglucosamine 1-carboxyvinyltransferase [Bacilli bacterium]|nr:UDP-N-acetylglucosamine 1-carboxyvinyltransferase [Bacilli bacterium]MCI9434255.1 UDP-N-acetylglucosamine 1-carboxyvinyltransferase [Bacilli bacterium]